MPTAEPAADSARHVAPETAPEIDGRRLRRSRNRDAVVEALLALVDRGDLDPTIAQVADEAGISARSVFRYFDDVDDLVRAAIQRQQERLAPLMARRVDPSLDRTARLAAFVEHRAELLEAMGNVGRLARLRAPVQPLVAEELARIRSVLREQVRVTFGPELGDGRAATLRLAAADVACSFEAFDSLVRDHRLSRADAAAAMALSLRSLFGEATDAR